MLSLTSHSALSRGITPATYIITRNQVFFKDYSKINTILTYYVVFNLFILIINRRSKLIQLKTSILKNLSLSSHIKSHNDRNTGQRMLFMAPMSVKYAHNSGLNSGHIPLKHLNLLIRQMLKERLARNRVCPHHLKRIKLRPSLFSHFSSFLDIHFISIAHVR